MRSDKSEKETRNFKDYIELTKIFLQKKLIINIGMMIGLVKFLH